MLLEALRQVNLADALIVIVPRHPQRFDAVARLLEQNDIAYQRRSAGGTLLSATRVILGDSMGEMIAYYAACDIAFVGGSLLPLGGQNLIEACAAGRAVIVGPYTFNFADATRQAVAAGAALQVGDARAVAVTAGALFGDSARAQQMAQAGRDFVRSHQGATERVVQMVRVRCDE
jgi:3-deoxy-D-manno-octulosonic-acid transferase